MNVKNENKDYFTVGEIAEILGVNKNTILHYDRENVVKAIRSENNYRYYSKDSVRVFKIVLRLRKLGFSLEKIKEMGKFIEEKKYSAISDLMKQKMEENKREIEEIEKNMKILKSEEKYLEYLNDVNSFEEKEKFNKEPSNFFCIKTCEKEAGIVIDIENIEKNIESQKNFIRKELMKYKRDIPWLKKYFFGRAISKEKILQEKYECDKFIIKKDIERYPDKYIFPKGEYAFLYLKENVTKEIIKYFLNKIEENEYEILGDLFIENISIFEEENEYEIRILKILIKSLTSE